MNVAMVTRIIDGLVTSLFRDKAKLEHCASIIIGRY